MHDISSTVIEIVDHVEKANIIFKLYLWYVILYEKSKVFLLLYLGFRHY